MAKQLEERSLPAEGEELQELLLYGNGKRPTITIRTGSPPTIIIECTSGYRNRISFAAGVALEMWSSDDAGASFRVRPAAGQRLRVDRARIVSWDYEDGPQWQAAIDRARTRRRWELGALEVELVVSTIDDPGA